MTDERGKDKSAYFDRSQSIGVDQITPFLDDLQDKNKLSSADRSFVLAAACYLEAAGKGKLGEFGEGKFREMLKETLTEDAAFGLEVANDLVVYVTDMAARVSEWKYQENLGPKAAGNKALNDLYEVVYDGLRRAVAANKEESNFLKNEKLSRAIGRFANNFTNRVVVMGEELGEDEIGPEPVFLPKDLVRKFEALFSDEGVKRMVEVAKQELLSQIREN